MKIFIAVGTQLAFDRLLQAVDAWAEAHPGSELFAQAGPAVFQPRHIETRHFVAPEVFGLKCREADVIVAHAGTGTIFTALELRKPIIVMPRLARYQEHRNDHQLATVERFKDRPGINVAWDERDIPRLLDNVAGLSVPTEEFSKHASRELLDTVREFVGTAPRMSARGRLTKLVRALRP